MARLTPNSISPMVNSSLAHYTTHSFSLPAVTLCWAVWSLLHVSTVKEWAKDLRVHMQMWGFFALWFPCLLHSPLTFKLLCWLKPHHLTLQVSKTMALGWSSSHLVLVTLECPLTKKPYKYELHPAKFSSFKGQIPVNLCFLLIVFLWIQIAVFIFSPEFIILSSSFAAITGIGTKWFIFYFNHHKALWFKYFQSIKTGSSFSYSAKNSAMLYSIHIHVLQQHSQAYNLI